MQIYTVRQEIEEVLNILPQFWYIFQDTNNLFVKLLIDQNLIDNSSYLCQYITEYAGINTIINLVVYQNSIVYENYFSLKASDNTSIFSQDGFKIIVKSGG